VEDSVVDYVISRDFQYEEIQSLKFTMPTQKHDDIASNLHGLLFQLLKGKDFRVYSQATSVIIPNTGKIRNPDIVIVPRDTQNRTKLHQITNPIVLFEILSKSTQ
jgi:Uma2 family endonuclease